MTNVEVEHRGLLSKEKFQELKDFFSKNAKFLEEKDRFSVIYIQSKGRSYDEMKDELIDLKVRITNKKAELVMKYGKCSGKDSRKEFLFDIDPKKFDEMMEFLKILGFDHGVLNATKTFVFLYKGVEFALVEVPGWGYYFEAEILTDSKSIKETDKKIEEECKKLSLKIVDEKKFYKLLEELNSREGYAFDFNKQNFTDIKKRFIIYF